MFVTFQVPRKSPKKHILRSDERASYGSRSMNENLGRKGRTSTYEIKPCCERRYVSEIWNAVGKNDVKQIFGDVDADTKE